MVIGLVIGGQEIIWIVIAVGVLFGATRIPLFMRGLGQGIKEFKTSVRDDAPETPASAPQEVAGAAQPPAAPVDPGEPNKAG